eukprot:scaffold55679_cov38-Tisochrysis_lutea.AAC.5
MSLAIDLRCSGPAQVLGSVQPFTHLGSPYTRVPDGEPHCCMPFIAASPVGFTNIRTKCINYNAAISLVVATSKPGTRAISAVVCIARHHANEELLAVGSRWVREEKAGDAVRCHPRGKRACTPRSFHLPILSNSFIPHRRRRERGVSSVCERFAGVIAEPESSGDFRICFSCGEQGAPKRRIWRREH